MLDAQIKGMSTADLCALADDVDDLLATLDDATRKSAPRDVVVSRTLELRIKRLLVKQYADLFDRGTEVAIEAFLAGLRSGGMEVATDALVNKYRANLATLPELVSEPIGAHLTEMYDLGRELAVVEAGAPARVSFGLVDQATLDWLKADSHFWIRNYVDKDLGEMMANAIREASFDEGMPIEGLAKQLKELLGAKFGQSEAYWNVVASAGANRTRNFARLRGYGAAEIETFTIATMGDENVCDTCRPMEGRRVSVAKANGRLDDLLADEDPQAIKEYFPWMNADEAARVTDRQMMNGTRLPQFHGR